MANVNLNNRLHKELWKLYLKQDKTEFPSYKNMLEKMLKHSISCETFVRNK